MIPPNLPNPRTRRWRAKWIWPSAAIIGSKRRSGPGADAPPAAGPWTKLVPRDIPFMAGDTLLPERVTSTEESVDLQLNTTNPAPGLSMTGQPIQYTRCEHAETLCTEEGVAIFQSSREHLNLDFGSLYSPAVVLDFGRIITARVRLDLDGPAGAIIDIGYAERLIDGHFNICVDGAGIADRTILKDGPQVFETWHTNGRWTSGEFVGILNSHSHAWSACVKSFMKSMGKKGNR